MKQLDGYVVYYKDHNNKFPLGVISENYDCKAFTNYIPKLIKKYLIEIEDKRFYKHNGLDLRGVTRAFIENIKAGKIIQGGSTISQQLSRNLLKDNSKTIARKIRETIKAFQIENQNSKDEILNLYFNNVYFGKNIWGIRTAGLHYFSKEIEHLTQTELLFLLTILRGPNFYIKRPEITYIRFKKINELLLERKMISTGRIKKNLNFDFKLNETQLSNIKIASIPYITESTNRKLKIINSTIDLNLQKFTEQFVAESKYPVSIIALSKGKVVAFSSSYGSDYPFISKANVGSTLKPFIYCYLRECGIAKIEQFDSTKNSMGWSVREAAFYNSKLNIEEALLYSNNNSFLNAAAKTGIENNLKYLASIFSKDDSEFFPSSILGATKNGLSIYELGLAYSNYFEQKNLTPTKIECLSILNKIFCQKLGLNIDNAFLKTGTTNNNKERYAVLGNPDLTYVVLRNENKINDESKEGSLMKQLTRNIKAMLKLNNNYTWI